VWLWQLACALCALREAKILHMDIKVDNILLSHGENGGIDDLLLADFGIAREMPSGGPTVRSAIVVSQEHVAIEMNDFMKNVHQSLLTRLNIREADIANVERDITAIMSQYVIDESSDMCKYLMYKTL
jgi:serine/threonine protein kinase